MISGSKRVERIYKTDRFFRFPMDDGIDPVRLLLLTALVKVKKMKRQSLLFVRGKCERKLTTA